MKTEGGRIKLLAWWGITLLSASRGRAIPGVCDGFGLGCDLGVRVRAWTGAPNRSAFVQFLHDSRVFVCAPGLGWGL